MDHVSEVIFGTLCVVAFFVGLLFMSRAEDQGIFIFGSLLAVFGLGFGWQLLSRHLSEKYPAGH